MPIYTATRRKSVDERSPLVRHIDEWQRLSADARKKVVGEGWFEDVEKFISLTGYGNDQAPSFRPQIAIPELQSLMFNEGNDLSELSPIVYIFNGISGKREEDRERIFRSEWRQMMVNYHLMFSILWSLFGGTGFLQGGYDPDARNGKGSFWAKMRHPKSTFPDPTTDYDLNWSYLILEDMRHIEWVKSHWPLTSARVKPKIAGMSSGRDNLLMNDSGYGFQMPPGPMSMIPGMPADRTMPSDSRVRVRYAFCKDYTREKVENQEIPEGAITTPDFLWKYPNGRLIVECEGEILQDGDNPYPQSMFNVVPVWGMPPMLGSIWATPPIRYTQALQGIAERMLTGVFENGIRLNNGVWFIDARTGIDPNDFGGLPGEVRIIDPNSPVPQCVFPAQMPAHFTQLPELLLNKQRVIQGFTEARQGKPGAGNISPDLQDASIEQSKGLTQLRGRMLGFSVQTFAELMFYTMARYYKTMRMAVRGDAGAEYGEWKNIQRPDQYDVLLDEASIQPMSEAMLRRIAPELKKVGALPDKELLEVYKFPDAAGVAQRIEREKELAALGRVKGNRR